MRSGEQTAERGLALRTRAFLALAAGVLAISFTAIFTKWAAVPGPIAAMYRMGIAAIVLSIPFLRHFRHLPRTTYPSLSWGVFGGLWFAANLGLLNSALRLTSAANATLLDNTAPIWVGLGAMVFFRERLGLRYWTGLALALLGAAIVMGMRFSAGLVVRRGDALAFVGALFYAGYLLNTQRGRTELDPITYPWLVAVAAARSITWST